MFWQKSYRLEWYLIIWHYLNLYVYSISFMATHFLLWKLTGAKFNFESMFQQERNLKVLSTDNNTDTRDITRTYKICQKTTNLARWQPSLNSSQWWPTFFKSRSNSQVKAIRSKLWYHVKGLATSNTHNLCNMKTLPLLVWKLWTR